MTIFLIIMAVMIYGAFSIWKYRKQYQNQIQNLRTFDLEILGSNTELHWTLANGLYQRFKRPEAGEEKEENPLLFEKFVAKVLENYYGGSAFVTKSSGDFGVDIEHKRDDGLYLGQVKCSWGSIGFDPIAIIHSQMVKQDAKGGFVITTSDFTANALKYARDLNIDLIDGKMLAQYWILGLENQLDTVKELKLQLNPST